MSGVVLSTQVALVAALLGAVVWVTSPDSLVAIGVVALLVAIDRAAWGEAAAEVMGTP
jgi:hypothetical protein